MPADVRETHKLIIAHITNIRKTPGFEFATAVLVLESNLAFESQHIMHALNNNRVTKWVALSEGAAGSVGWLTVRKRAGATASCVHRFERLSLACADKRTQGGHGLPGTRRLKGRSNRHLERICVLYNEQTGSHEDAAG